MDSRRLWKLFPDSYPYLGAESDGPDAITKVTISDTNKEGVKEPELAAEALLKLAGEYDYHKAIGILRLGKLAGRSEVVAAFEPPVPNPELDTALVDQSITPTDRILTKDGEHTKAILLEPEAVNAAHQEGELTALSGTLHYQLVAHKKHPANGL